MAVIDVNWNPTPKELRVFGGLLVGFCAIIGGISYSQSQLGETSILVPISIGGAIVGTIGCVAPFLIRHVYVVWMALVLPIGIVISNLLIGFVFYFVVWPIGVVMRWKRGDALQLKFDESASYWQKRTGPSDPKRYFRQY